MTTMTNSLTKIVTTNKGSTAQFLFICEYNVTNLISTSNNKTIEKIGSSSYEDEKVDVIDVTSKRFVKKNF